MVESANREAAKRIMLVEDDPSFLNILCLMLQDWGCQVIKCRDGYEALGALRDMEPAWILSDLDFPFRSGIELFKKCREVAGKPGIPFVIISGIADAEDRLEEIRDELLGFYAKPVPVETLKRIVFGQVGNKAH